MPKKYCVSLTTRPPFPCHAPINPEAALLMTAFVKNVPIYEQTTNPKGRTHTRCISKNPLECLLNGSECCNTCKRKKKTQVIDMTYKPQTYISECLDMIKDPFKCKPQVFFFFFISIHISVPFWLVKKHCLTFGNLSASCLYRITARRSYCPRHLFEGAVLHDDGISLRFIYLFIYSFIYLSLCLLPEREKAWRCILI